MTLLDSNIIIYSALLEYEFLLEFIRKKSPFVSDISRVEVLGFRELTAEDIFYFESFFESTILITVSEKVILEAISLRQIRKMSLGDSIVAATAIVNDLELITSNTKDFKWISSLKIINPLENL